MATTAVSRIRRQQLDFGDALLHVLSNEYDEVLLEFAVEDVPAVAMGALALPVAAGKGLWDAAKHVFDVGISQATFDAYEGAKAFAGTATEVPGRAMQAASYFYDEFVFHLEKRQDTSDKALFVGRLSTYLGTFAASAVVGADTPDKDITVLGIGSHRNFFFHSAAIALGVKLICRLMLRVASRAEKLVKKGSDDHEALVFIATNLKAVSFGYAVGTATHLVKDATFDGSKAVTGPLGGTLIDGTIVDDDAWLLLNGFVAIMAGEEPKKRRKRKVRKTASKKKATKRGS